MRDLASVQGRQPLPHDIAVEQELLGALLMNNQVMHLVQAFVGEEHFYEPLHQQIFRVAVQLIGSNKPATPTTLGAFLPKDVKVFDLTIRQYMARLAASATTVVNAPEFARIVRDLADYRDIILLTEQMTSLSDSVDPAEIATAAIARLSEIVESRSDNGAPAMDMAQATARAIDAAASAFERDGKPRGLSYGLRALDAKTLGAMPADLVVMAGRPGMGKSALMLSVARNMAQAGERVLIWSGEMGDVALTTRMIADELWRPRDRLSYWQIASGKFREQKFLELRDAALRIAKLPIRIEQQPGLTIAQIGARARQYKRRHGLKALFVDHLGLVKPSGRYAGNKVNETGEITTGLKGLAKELDIPVFLLCQINRGVEQRDDKRPGLSDLRNCLPISASVVDPVCGFSRPLSDILSGGAVLSVNPDLRAVVGSASEVWATGKKQIFKMVTRSGYSVRASSGHRFLAESGWRELGLLSVGDLIAAPRTLPSPDNAKAISVSRALLLGLLIGDGYLKGTPELALSLGEQSQFFIELAREFDLVPEVIDIRHTKAKKIRYTTGRMSGAGKNPLTSWLREIGVWGLTSSAKTLPQEVFSWSDDALAACLRGLFHADGSFSDKNSSRANVIRLASISELLCRAVKTALLRFGIISTIRRHSALKSGFRSKTGWSWTLSITGNEHVAAFVRQIGFCGLKHERARAAMARARYMDNGSIDRLPHFLGNVVRSHGLSHTAAGWRSQGKRMSRRKALELSERLGDGVLHQFATSDVHWDEVVSIEPDGFEDTFDVHVPGTHNFVVDGVFSHNSGDIEQDADTVLILYRAAYYLAKKEPLAGSAEFIIWADEMAKVEHRLDVAIEKQRSGPTGTVRLHCDIASNAIRDEFSEMDDALPMTMAPGEQMEEMT